MGAMQRSKQRVVIAGGGTAGWMAASTLAKYLGPLAEIELIESDEIGTVGVGEATIPQIRNFTQALEIDEDEMIRATQATFKLAIRFENWLKLGHSYYHTFGDTGIPLNRAPFQHFWLRARHDPRFADLWAYNANAHACLGEKFTRAPFQMGTRSIPIAYAFHFDATLFAKYLRGYSEARGVRRTEGKIVEVQQHGESGDVTGLTLESGRVVEGDLFLDCSGFRALLIEGTLKAGFEDWSHWLPCDRAFAVPTRNVGATHPYTQSTAHEAGWQWRIPLQHRTGNGHVFCSAHVSEDAAREVLLAYVQGEVLAEPRLLKFKAGRRRETWKNNVIAIGLAGGFLEPLESTSIHLIQSGIARLLGMFPNGPVAEAERAEFNRQSAQEYARIRDFIILHYHLNERSDSPFWIQCREMSIPEELARKLAYFRASGGIYREQEDLFTESSWLQVMVGQGLMPERYHPFADQISDADLEGFLTNMRTIMDRAASAMPTQAQFIKQHCAAPEVAL
ncbi:MAG: tryptophan halogenase family protein [Pseudomonadota bacterium]